jgi:hypothetical protein
MNESEFVIVNTIITKKCVICRRHSSRLQYYSCMDCHSSICQECCIQQRDYPFLKDNRCSLCYHKEQYKQNKAAAIIRIEQECKHVLVPCTSCSINQSNTLVADNPQAFLTHNPSIQVSRVFKTGELYTCVFCKADICSNLSCRDARKFIHCPETSHFIQATLPIQTQVQLNKFITYICESCATLQDIRIPGQLHSISLCNEYGCKILQCNTCNARQVKRCTYCKNEYCIQKHFNEEMDLCNNCSKPCSGCKKYAFIATWWSCEANHICYYCVKCKYKKRLINNCRNVNCDTNFCHLASPSINTKHTCNSCMDELKQQTLVFARNIYTQQFKFIVLNEIPLPVSVADIIFGYSNIFHANQHDFTELQTAFQIEQQHTFPEFIKSSEQEQSIKRRRRTLLSNHIHSNKLLFDNTHANIIIE